MNNTPNNIPEYIPDQPTQTTPAPAYELKSDVTGKRDANNLRNTITFKGQVIDVPFAPNKNCRRCYGRGYLGFDTVAKRIMPCPKCFKHTR